MMENARSERAVKVPIQSKPLASRIGYLEMASPGIGHPRMRDVGGIDIDTEVIDIGRQHPPASAGAAANIENSFARQRPDIVVDEPAMGIGTPNRPLIGVEYQRNFENFRSGLDQHTRSALDSWRRRL